MCQAFDSVVSYLDDNEVRHITHDAQNKCDALLFVNGVTRVLTITYSETDGLLALKCATGLGCPIGAKPAIAEAIARVNLKVKVGQFCLDFADGELFYEIVQIHDDEDVAVPDELLNRIVGTSIGTTIDLTNVFSEVIFANESADSAVNHFFSEAPGEESPGDED